MEVRRFRAVVVTGPTGSGKSAFSILLAKKILGEVINCDPSQSYTDGAIGSNKISADEMQGVPHHLISQFVPSESPDVGIYTNLVASLVDCILSRGNIPILVGASGMYLTAILSGLTQLPPKNTNLRNILDRFSYEQLKNSLQEIDFVRASQIEVNDRFRLIRALEIAYSSGELPSKLYLGSSKLTGIDSIVICLWPNRKSLYQKLLKRSEAMIQGGLLAEVLRIATNWGVDAPILRNLGFREAKDFLVNLGVIRELVEPSESLSNINIGVLKEKLEVSKGHGEEVSVNTLNTLDRLSQFIDSNPEAVEKLVQEVYLATKQYAKQQYTYLRNSLLRVCLSYINDKGVGASEVVTTNNIDISEASFMSKLFMSRKSVLSLRGAFYIQDLRVLEDGLRLSCVRDSGQLSPDFGAFDYKEGASKTSNEADFFDAVCYRASSCTLSDSFLEYFSEVLGFALRQKYSDGASGSVLFYLPVEA